MANSINSLDLDVDSPDQVASVLRAAAERYINDSMDLDAAWQSKTAGQPWRTIAIAQILERAADSIDKHIS
jgi:hypothetical protein